MISLRFNTNSVKFIHMDLVLIPNTKLSKNIIIVYNLKGQILFTETILIFEKSEQLRHDDCLGSTFTEIPAN